MTTTCWIGLPEGLGEGEGDGEGESDGAAEGDGEAVACGDAVGAGEPSGAREGRGLLDGAAVGGSPGAEEPPPHAQTLKTASVIRRNGMPRILLLERSLSLFYPKDQSRSRANSSRL